MQNISVLGVGKLGLGFALLLEKNGYNVLGLDIQQDYINNLNNKTIKFSEPGYDTLLKNSINFKVTNDLNESLIFSDIIFIIVQTPNGGGEKFYDHTILSNLLFKISNIKLKQKNIIIGCTVMPGYIDQIAKTLLPDHHLSYNPEFVAQGDIIHGFEHPDLILVGTDNEDLKDIIKSIYSFTNCTNFCFMKPLEAEIVKISLNGFITTKISYANMISDLCDKLNADKYTVLDAIGSDSRIGKLYFKPGNSFGGPCFPRDTKALKQLMDQNNINSDLLTATTVYNEEHIKYQVFKHYTNILDKKIIIEDVCYKENTSLPIIEESAKLKIAKQLKMLNFNVTIRDSKLIIDEVKKEFGNLFEYAIKNEINFNFKQDAVYNYWNTRPCNIKHSDKVIGTKEYFDEVTKRKYFIEPHIIEFAEFEKWKGKEVLEVGCGIGTAAQTFVEHGAIYTGIDISDYSIELARQRFDVNNLNGNFCQFNIENKIKNENQFDLIYSFGVLHHTPDIKKSITNCFNLLKHGGEFKLMLYAKNSFKYLQIKSGLDQFEAQSDVPIANVYTNDEIFELLSEFKEIKIKQTHIFPYNIEEYKKYNYIKVEPFDTMSPEQFKIMEDHLGWHLCISCKKS